jgi:hypothetical protein
MARLPNWRSRFYTYLASKAATPFEAGEHDCSLFTAGCVERITGEDYAEDYRGAYSTVAEGQALLAADGYADQEALVDALFEEIEPVDAREGDVAVVQLGTLRGLGVFVGNGIAVVALKGLGIVPRSEARRAFRVE